MKTNWKVAALRSVSASLLLVCLATASVAQRIADPERRSILVSAGHAYYNARVLGLGEFSCVAELNLAPLIDSTANPESVKILKAQHYYLKINREGAAELTHKSDFPLPQELEKNMKDMYEGMREMTSGFFTVWSAFMMRNPFPDPDSKCELLSTTEEYELHCDEPSGNMVTLFKKDFSITEVRAKAPGVTTIMRPVFNKTPAGYILAGYDADAETTALGKVKSHVEVVYDTQTTYQLPGRIKFDGSVGDKGAKIDLLLSNYQLAKQ